MNDEIKLAMFSKGMKQWELAESLGLHESVLSRKMRHELPDDEKKKILAVIDARAINKRG